MSFIVGGMMTSCGSSKIFLEAATPQEQGIQLTKITDETQNSVVGNRTYQGQIYTLNTSGTAASRKKGICWDTGTRLAVSPDGKELAYISIVDDASNVMIKQSAAGGPSTQRTFRRAQTIDWSRNGNIYFNDNTGNTSTLGEIDAHKGSLVKQMTNNNNDWYPVSTKNGEILYFTRFDTSGPSIWMLNKSTGELTNCARGFNPEPYGDDPYKILCSRNSTKGNTEIWMLDLKNGTETMLLSDSDKGFSSPKVSPDGEWVLVVANSLSSINNKQNTDIYAVKMDGSQLTQLTYHPEVDTSPVWSSDGKYIYFISSRANKDRKFNIWRMNNPLSNF